MERTAFVSYLLGLVVALLLSVVLTFVFAVAISYFPISPNLIKPINGVIKAVSAIIGCIFAVKGSKGFIKGITFGAIYFLLSYLLFGAIAGKFSFGLNILFDLLLCAIAGAIAGIIRSNAARS